MDKGVTGVSPEQEAFSLSTLDVLLVAAELAPNAKTGGLGDMVAALAGTLTAHGIKTRLLIPGYPKLLSSIQREEVVDIGSVLGFPADSEKRPRARGLE
jgi:hypothetical protein